MRNFVTKLGTNVSYFKEYMDGDFLKNGDVKDFISKKLKEQGYLFAFLKKDSESLDFLKEIVKKSYDNKRKTNKWISITDISSLYKTSTKSKKSAEILKTLITNKILVKKNAAVRFVSNEVYYAFLQF